MTLHLVSENITSHSCTAIGVKYLGMHGDVSPVTGTGSPTRRHLWLLDCTFDCVDQGKYGGGAVTPHFEQLLVETVARNNAELALQFKEVGFQRTLQIPWFRRRVGVPPSSPPLRQLTGRNGADIDWSRKKPTLSRGKARGSKKVAHTTSR